MVQFLGSIVIETDPQVYYRLMGCQAIFSVDQSRCLGTTY